MFRNQFDRPFNFAAHPQGSWRCHVCAIVNLPSVTTCMACEARHRRRQDGSTVSGAAGGALPQEPSPSLLTLHPMPPVLDTLAGDLMYSLVHQDLTDVVFIVDGQEIHAHKVVLASRSEYFRSMLYGKMQESSSRYIEKHDNNNNNDNHYSIPIHDCSAGIFRKILAYIYSGNPGHSTFEELMELHLKTDMFQLQELKQLCEIRLAQRLTSGNVLDVLSQSRRLVNSSLLKKFALEYVLYHMRGDQQLLDSINSWPITCIEDGEMMQEILSHVTMARFGRPSPV